MGFLDTVFGGGDTQKSQLLAEDPLAKRSRERLEAITQEPLREVPLRGIADIPQPTEETTLGKTTLKGLLEPTETPDLLSLPDVQALIFEATERGNLLANRLGRGLQKTGGASSTPGRDILGRVATDVSKSITASLAPIIESQRNRAFADTQRRGQIAELLTRIGRSDEERLQIVDQLGLDALFNQQTTESRRKLDELIPILQFLASSGPGAVPFVQEGRPGIIEQVGAVASLGTTLGGLFKKPA